MLSQIASKVGGLSDGQLIDSNYDVINVHLTQLSRTIAPMSALFPLL